MTTSGMNLVAAGVRKSVASCHMWALQLRGNGFIQSPAHGVPRSCPVFFRQRGSMSTTTFAVPFHGGVHKGRCRVHKEEREVQGGHRSRDNTIGSVFGHYEEERRRTRTNVKTSAVIDSHKRWQPLPAPT
ncbi:hypothetical protein DEO72_LG11g369 [Vigna unguiculata]|uniref:Uncharacterized protein n=1 Tax=Vigna unguiculata TaxID=3917 RepID=A0A4D6NI86_VIGUN|nr:hypothetical protein DEO72_LG11g369 [Vigna unguiculata]